MMLMKNPGSYANGRRYTIMYCGNYSFKESWINIRYSYINRGHSYSYLGGWGVYYDR